MSHDYSPESKLLELPNPYQLQKRLLSLSAAALLIGGVTALFRARAAMQENALRLIAGPLIAGLAMIATGLVCAATSARGMRFLFGRGRPKSLSPDIPLGANGGSKMADGVKEILRQGGITYLEPQGAVEGMLYHRAPKLVTAMFSTEREALALSADLTRFARSHSVLVAPNSREDQARIAALNAGERTMLPANYGTGAAAQVQHHLYAVAAIASPGGVATATATIPKRFCADCAAPLAG